MAHLGAGKDPRTCKWESLDGCMTNNLWLMGTHIIQLENLAHFKIDCSLNLLTIEKRMKRELMVEKQEQCEEIIKKKPRREHQIYNQ